MLLKDVCIMTRGESPPEIEVAAMFHRKRPERDDEGKQIIVKKTLEQIAAEIPTQKEYTSFNPDYYYLLLDGSILIEKAGEPRVNVSCEYQSSSFTDYKNMWLNWVNQPITVYMGEKSLLLMFAVDHDVSPWTSSLKALKLTDSSIEFETVDNSFIIVVGDHEINGILKDTKIERQLFFLYKIGGNDTKSDVTNEVLEPGSLSIKAIGTCSIVYMIK